MVDTFPSVKAIHDMFAPIFAKSYKNERDLFKNVMIKMIDDVHTIAKEYLYIFEILRDSNPTDSTDIDEIINVLMSFQKENYDSRRDFFDFSSAMYNRLQSRLIDSQFRRHAETFFFCLLKILLGPAVIQDNMGTRYRSLIAYLRYTYLKEESTENKKLYHENLKAYCDLNLEQLEVFVRAADREFAECKAALVRL